MNMKKRSLLICIIILVLLLVLIGGVMIRIQGMTRTIDHEFSQVRHVDTQQMPDGTYEGSFGDFLVSVHVSVQISGGSIDGIEITDQSSGPGYDAQEILERIIREQTPLVDTVSGATSSSKAIMTAVFRALIQNP